MKLEYIESYNFAKQDQAAEVVIIWLHGLGADCNDFLPIARELNLNKNVKFIFPNAPMQPITVNNGYVMRAWYDIKSLTALGNLVDQAGILSSVMQIEQLIEQQIELGFKSTQIIIAGFSQGGVISLTTGIRSKYKLAGIIGLSCYLPDAVRILSEFPKSYELPFFMAHGKFDQVVPYLLGKQACEALSLAKFDTTWGEYDMPHSVCTEEINDIADWLNQLDIKQN